MKRLAAVQWYMENIWAYAVQMIPCMCLAVVLFFLVRPFRMKRLMSKGLVSGSVREAALLLFGVFVAGLAALTLFPADFWRYVMDRVFYPDCWTETWGGAIWQSFYPSLEQILTENRDLHNLFVPFQEIRRAQLGIPWLTFMLLGNILMFVPIGFFTALLWRKGTWWRSTLIGLMASAAIEAVQFFIGRRTDIDDVILNTSGALLGFVLYAILRLVVRDGIKQFQCEEESDRNG